MDWSYLLFRFDGRIGRRPYWIASGVLFVAAALGLFVEFYLDNQRLGPIFSLIVLYPNLAVMVKRAHDRDMPLWTLIATAILVFFLDAVEIFRLPGPIENPGVLDLIVVLTLLALIPLIVYLFIVLGFFRGTPGANRHGPEPTEGTS